MHSANLTALSWSVACFLPPVPVPVLVAVAVPVSEGAFEPQPALPRLISASSARATSGRGLLLMFAPCVGWVARTRVRYGHVLGHRCILGSCVGSAYMRGQP